jgi:hypothetical protein
LVVVRRSRIEGIYISAKTPDARLVLQTKKKAELELTPLRKNPKRRKVLKLGSEPYDLQVFYYIDNPNFCCVSYRGMFISISVDDFDTLRLGLTKFESMKDEREKNRLEWMKKSGRERETRLKTETGCYEWDY